MATFSVDLNGQTAVVTGAGEGIGRACALALAASGAYVMVNDLNPDRADTVAQQIVEAGGKAIPWQADIASRFQVTAMIENARDAFGRIGILVNAAGVGKAGQALTLDEWDWRRILEVNLNGAFFCSQLLGRVMADEGGGVIVNIASASPFSPIREGVGYATSKAGLVAMTQQLARELAPRGIRINAVCPGHIEEDDAPAPMLAPALGHTGTPDDVAAAVLFLCSDGARFITGQALIVNGGV